MKKAPVTLYKVIAAVKCILNNLIVEFVFFIDNDDGQSTFKHAFLNTSK